MAFEMTDIQKELQKLKALINQRQSTAIFSNKSNESTKLALGDVELYINDMTRKFSFTAAGVKNPVLIDPKRKALENVEYLNGIKVDDITTVTADVEALKEITTTHTYEIADCQSSIIDIERKDIEQDERLDAFEDHNHDDRYALIDHTHDDTYVETYTKWTGGYTPESYDNPYFGSCSRRDLNNTWHYGVSEEVYNNN
jgi:hypothetical protein